VREPEICHRPIRLSFALALLVFGCKSEEPAAEPETKREIATPQASEPSPKPEAEPQPDPSAVADPERADKLADLDAMCKAVDHDYDDGTLTDYYRDIEPRTEWGKAQRDAGNESIKPGRLLEKAVAELSPGAKDPALTNCRKLLDYLDDVE
jgi:hypothetical protein